MAHPLVRDAMTGLAAGLVASAAMNVFQSRLKDAVGDPDPPRETSTATAVERVAETVAHTPLPPEARAPAGTALHYAFGAGLGLVYAVAGERYPALRAGYGTLYGAAVSLLADELAVPALRLSPPAREVSAVNHLRGFVSHLVFGLVLEGTRRLLVRRGT